MTAPYPPIMEPLYSVRERVRTSIAAVRTQYPTAPPSDLRINSLAKLVNTVLSAELALAFSADELRSEQWWTTHSRGLYEIINGVGELDGVVQEVSRLILIGAMYSWFSVIESTIRQLCVAICPPEPDDWAKVYSRVFSQALADRESRKFANQTFNFQRLMRNAIHTNNYHSRPTVSCTFRGHLFTFTKGSNIEFADWPTVIGVFDATLDVLLELFRAPNIAAIPTLKDLHDRWP